MRGDGGNHHEKLGHREFRVRGNLPSLIWQVQVPIRRVIRTIQGLPNPIKQVIPRVSHILLYPPHCSHIHLPSLPFSSTTCTIIAEYKLMPSLSISPCHDLELTPSTCIHRVQHTLSTAYTKYSIPKNVCLPFILMSTTSAKCILVTGSLQECLRGCGV